MYIHTCAPACSRACGGAYTHTHVHEQTRVSMCKCAHTCACTCCPGRCGVCVWECVHTHVCTHAPPPHFPHQVARGWCLPTESPPQSQSRGGAWPAGQVGLLTKHGPLLGTPDVRETPGEGAFHSRPSVPRGSRAPTGPGTQAEQSCMGRGRGSSLTLPSQTPRGMGPFCPHPDPTPVCVCVYACMCWHTCALRTHVFIF